MVRSLSYVAQARHLQRLKEEDSFCRQQMKTGQFLLYSKGRPLLQGGRQAMPQPLWLDYQQSSRWVPQLEQSCAILGLGADGSLQLAANAGEFKFTVPYELAVGLTGGFSVQDPR